MWDPVFQNHTSRVQSKHTALITTKTMRFKNIKAGCMMGSDTIRDVYETEVGCAEVCMDEPSCITWNQPDQSCMIYDKVFRANPRKVLYYYGGDCITYEVWNPCTEKMNLCEHGSICSPNRLTKTYECINCSPPYTGQHCNETLSGPGEAPPPAPPEVIHEDILLGRNKSCRSLFHHFQIEHLWKVYHIHPWNDHRKIKVLCKSQDTRLTSLNSANLLPIREIKGEDLQDGLDISQVSTGSIRVHTSFMKALESLIQFDYILLHCRQKNSSLAYDLNSAPLFKPFDYFLGLTDDRPPKYSMAFHAHYGDMVLDPIDGFLSDANVSVDERAFKNIVVNSDGKKFTMSNESMQCFGDDGDWIWFTMDIR
ncbi:uncharacterized protein [Clytia hemisphaerica]